MEKTTETDARGPAEPQNLQDEYGNDVPTNNPDTSSAGEANEFVPGIPLWHALQGARINSSSEINGSRAGQRPIAYSVFSGEGLAMDSDDSSVSDEIPLPVSLDQGQNLNGPIADVFSNSDAQLHAALEIYRNQVTRHYSSGHSINSPEPAITPDQVTVTINVNPSINLPKQATAPDQNTANEQVGKDNESTPRASTSVENFLSAKRYLDDEEGIRRIPRTRRYGAQGNDLGIPSRPPAVSYNPYDVDDDVEVMSFPGTHNTYPERHYSLSDAPLVQSYERFIRASGTANGLDAMDGPSTSRQAALNHQQREIAAVAFLKKVINNFEELRDVFLVQVREQTDIIKKLISEFKAQDEGFLLEFNKLQSDIKSSNFALNIEVNRLKLEVAELDDLRDVLKQHQSSMEMKGLANKDKNTSHKFYVDICIDLCQDLMLLSQEFDTYENKLNADNLESLVTYNRVLLKFYEIPNDAIYYLEKAKNLD